MARNEYMTIIDYIYMIIDTYGYTSSGCIQVIGAVLKQPCSRLIPPMVSNPISRRGLTVAGPPALRRSQGATGPSSNQVGTDGGLNGIFDGKDFYMGIQCGLP